MKHLSSVHWSWNSVSRHAVKTKRYPVSVFKSSQVKSLLTKNQWQSHLSYVAEINEQ